MTHVWTFLASCIGMALTLHELMEGDQYGND